MADLFEKITGWNLQGDTHQSQRKYVMGVIIVTGVGGAVLGALTSGIGCLLWIITVIKIIHYNKIPDDDK